MTPGHGSQYNRLGEKKGALRLEASTAFGVEVTDGQVIVDTKLVIQAPIVGVDTTGQQSRIGMSSPVAVVRSCEPRPRM